MLRGFLLFVGLMSLPGLAVADEPVGLPDPEILWIVENSWIGERTRSEMDLTIGDRGGLELPALDIPGVDLTWGDRYLEGVPEPEPIAPESVLGLSR